MNLKTLLSSTAVFSLTFGLILGPTASSHADSVAKIELGGWSSNSSSLITSQKTKIKKWFENSITGEVVKLSCLAKINAGATAKDKNLAVNRALSLCNFGEQLANTVVSKEVIKIGAPKGATQTASLLVYSRPSQVGVELLSATETCKLPVTSDSRAISSGFPRPNPSEVLPSSGTIKALIVPVDYSNYPATTKPEIFSSWFTQSLADYYSAMSYGKVHFQFTVLPTYVRMSKTAEDYGLSLRGRGDYGSFDQEALDLAAQNYDVAGYDVAYIVGSQETKKGVFTWGPAFTSSFSTKDGVVPRAAGAGGQDTYGTISQWITHETGHLFGLPDLYDRSANSQSEIFGRFGSYDIMANNWSSNLTMNGWSRFLLGWISDSDVLCMDARKTANLSLYLNRLNEKQGKRLFVLRMDESHVVAIEARSQDAFTYNTYVAPGSAWTKLLVYELDSARSIYKAPMAVISKNGLPVFGAQTDPLLSVAETMTVGGVKLSYLNDSGTSVNLGILINK